jgi:hypothetical protein
MEKQKNWEKFPEKMNSMDKSKYYEYCYEYCDCEDCTLKKKAKLWESNIQAVIEIGNMKVTLLGYVDDYGLCFICPISFSFSK